MLNARKPHFLEVFLPNLSSNRLKVPSKFVHHLGDRTSGSLTLIGPSGNEWHINLFEYEGHLYFREGWPTFVRDHAIQCGDTLVFGYDRDSKFTVHIFDDSSCEKDEALYAICSQRNFSQGVSESNEILGKRRERDVEGSSLELVDEKKMRSSRISAPQVSPVIKGEKKLKKCTKKSKKFKKTVASTCDVTSNTVVKESDTEVVLASPALTQTDLVTFHAKISSVVNKSREKKHNENETDNKKVPHISKVIERAAQYFTPTFPYFIRVMCYSSISGNGTMKIPSHFSSLHLPNQRIKITLMNLNGDRWIVNSIPTFRRSTTLHTICGGWKAFVRANNIKIEDVCIFELVGEFELRVRILPLGLKELERQLGNQSIVDVGGVGLDERCLEMIEYVAEDTTANPSKDLNETNEPDIQQEAASSVDTVYDPFAVLDPICPSASSLGTGDDSTSDELLSECNGGGTMSYQTSGNKEQDSQTMHMQPLVEGARDILSFTSPFPYFMKVAASSNVGGSFSLAIPRKFSAAHLPSHKSEVILRNLRGDSWNVVSSRYGKQMKFYGGWVSFARMNNVKLGDVLIFELLGEKEFQVHVFEGSQKVLQCVHNEAVVEDSTASVVSTKCGIMSET